MNCKMLLFDLDGTLLRNDKTISARTMSALAECRKRGLLIGVSTSRSEANCMTFLQKLQPDLLISSGAHWQDIRKHISAGKIFRKRRRPG